ncbi:MAG: uroporphyrinogen decarboxylase family protein [Clostridia bacterium]
MGRKLVYQTLEFDNPERAPRDIWILPWARMNYKDEVNKLTDTFEQDVRNAGGFTKKSAVEKGEMYEIGEYTDAWGCVFENIQRGVQGEVKNPLVCDEEWEDADNVYFPREFLEVDKEKVNAFCKDTDKFIFSGYCARPFERLQFIRGSENLYMDLVLKPDGLLEFIKKMHDFELKIMETWAQTDVDALMFMDDWGAQNNLLINPGTWLEIFKPMYRSFCDIAKAYNKKIFMHSDGNILKIYPHLIEIGVDALNSQVFCMGLDQLEKYKGQITFWGEIDRQHILPEGTPAQVEEAVRAFKNTLWHNGGCFAQCEFGPGARVENVFKVFDTWNKVV